ncbi:lysozyme inhibitor LprI family protein [Paraburkholderia sp. CI3]|uniref:lysozyme inhibitor LprI family protein n=1 Tax=Paraburkholderia sp. CI3 TaxID=2991060 RepID=UPI003D1E355E
MRYAIAILTFALLGTSRYAHAGAGNCAQAGDQANMNACADRSFKEADRELNKVYQALMGHMSEPAMANLLRAQRAWLAWRDAQCAFDTKNAQGGSAGFMAYSMCLTALTEAQTKHLAKQLNCPEGDITCSRH